jgi:hypothetical protein
MHANKASAIDPTFFVKLAEVIPPDLAVALNPMVIGVAMEGSLAAITAARRWLLTPAASLNTTMMVNERNKLHRSVKALTELGEALQEELVLWNDQLV